jgi:hypothetical protein
MTSATRSDLEVMDSNIEGYDAERPVPAVSPSQRDGLSAVCECISASTPLAVIR